MMSSCLNFNQRCDVTHPNNNDINALSVLQWNIRGASSIDLTFNPDNIKNNTIISTI